MIKIIQLSLAFSPQDDGPNHTKSHLHIAVNNFCNAQNYFFDNLFRKVCFYLTLSSDGHQLDTLAGNEVQGFVDIGNFVEPGKLQNYHYHLPVRS